MYPSVVACCWLSHVFFCREALSGAGNTDDEESEENAVDSDSGTVHTAVASDAAAGATEEDAERGSEAGGGASTSMGTNLLGAAEPMTNSFGR
jgi:hypothetical protein